MSRFYFYSLAFSLVLSGGILHAQALSENQFKKRILAEWGPLLESINTAQWEVRIEYYSSHDSSHLDRVDVIQHAFNHNAGSLWSEKIDDYSKGRKANGQRKLVLIQNNQYKAELLSPA